MTIDTGSGPRGGLVGRVMGLISKPRAEWAVIDTEPSTTQGLFTGYVMILAAIPAVISLIASLALTSMLGSFGGYGLAVHMSPVLAVVSAVISYAVSLIMVYVLALLIDAFAPSFGAIKNKAQAMKVAAYAPTVVWVAGVALIIPILGALVVLAAAIYAVFQFHIGLRTLMKGPEDKAVGYTAVVIIVGIIIGFVLNMVVSMPIGMMTARSALNNISAQSVTITTPDGSKVDVNAAAANLEALAKQYENGEAAKAADPTALQAMLPADLPGYTRSETSSGAGNMGPLGGSGASSTFTKGDSRIELSIADIGSMGAMAGMFKVSSNRETADSYEKVGTVGGRMTTEEYNRTSKSGTYGVLVGERFMIQAEGDQVTMDELKNAVGRISAAQLEAMAKG